jgi:VWFA-related protein
MKTTNGFFLGSHVLAWTGLFWLILITNSTGQENKVLPPGGSPAVKAEKDFTIRIAVDEVRLDVVVLDNHGHQVTNLNAGDFEIFQDGAPMDITSCTYVSDQTSASVRPGIHGKISKTAPSVPTPSITRDQVRRVIALVVDDYSMGGALSESFALVYRARMALKNFVDKQMEPGDLITILQTTKGNSQSQSFISDKQHLLARIEDIRWLLNVHASTVPDMSPEIQRAAISYCISALKDMPGRKAVLLITAVTGVNKRPKLFGNPGAQEELKRDNKIADEALRAGVVIHTLDMRGLEAPFLDPSGLGGGTTLAAISARALEIKLPFSQKTGGLFLENTNFFLTGIGEVNDALKGYYLLSYAPPPLTFKKGSPDVYHRTKVKVKSKGMEVHTRDGFFGTTASPAKATAGVSNTLRDAIHSPFRENGLTVNLASGYVNDPKAGYMVRSWLHLNWDELAKAKTAKDAEGRTITLKEGEGYLVDLETVSTTADVKNNSGDSSVVHYLFRIKEENVPFIKEHGMRFTFALPVKKPGGYYLRIAAQDKTSGKIGTAYQFVTIPNLLERRLALSNLFAISRDEDIAAIQSVDTPQNRRSWLVPMLQKDDGRSPAVREYQPGETVNFAMIVYNAKCGSGKAPDLESQYVLFKDGKELSRSQVQPVDIKGITNWSEIPVKGAFVLENAMSEGDYLLQFLVRDKRAKNATVAQTLDFRVLINASPQKVVGANAP